jgi:adenylate kinase family enzyme
VERVAVIACGGSGKTTLARELGRRLGLPVVHAHFVVQAGPDHVERPEVERRADLAAAAHGERWVIDALKVSTLNHRLGRADTAVFWGFPQEARPRILELLERHAADTEVVVLRSRGAVRRWLATVPAREDTCL